jgi:hypothetical protein
MGPTTGPTFAQVWVQLSYEDGVVTMVTNLNFSCGMLTDASFAYHLRSLNIRHFRAVAVTELKSRLKMWRRVHLQCHDLPFRVL